MLIMISTVIELWNYWVPWLNDDKNDGMEMWITMEKIIAGRPTGIGMYDVCYRLQSRVVRLET